MSTDFLEKIDKIYRAIREERGEISHGFLVEELIHQPVTKNQKSAGWSYSHTLFFFTGMALVAYGFFCYGLNLASTPLMQQLASFSGN